MTDPIDRLNEIRTKWNIPGYRARGDIAWLADEVERLVSERDAARLEVECLKAQQPLSMVETCRSNVEKGRDRCGACADCVMTEREAVVEAAEILEDIYTEYRSGDGIPKDLIDISVGCWLAKYAPERIDP